MKKILWIVFAAALTGLAGLSAAEAAVETGAPAPDFVLQDTQGNTHSLSGEQGKYVVLEWTNPDCPFVRKHYDHGHMQKLQAEWTDRGVVWYSINSSAEGKQGNYPPAEWNRILKEKGSAATALLLDPDGAVGRQYGAKTTPHMYIVNPEGVLIYQGAIDSKASANPADIESATNYVSQSLNEAMSGQPVSEPSTKPYGCSVKY